MEQFDPSTFPTDPSPVSARIKQAADKMLEELLLALRFERAVVLVCPDESWQVAGVHAVPEKDFWNLAPISLSIVQSAVEKKSSLSLMDAGNSAKFGGKDSVILAGIRSVACAPYVDTDNHARVLLYVDSRIDKGAFTPDDVGSLSEFASELGRRLFEGD